MESAAVMVTGGSGFIGTHLVRHLAKLGQTVVAVYRHKLPDLGENVYPVHADFSAPELMAAPLRGVKTVVHLAWEGGFSGGEAEGPLEIGGEQPASRNLIMLRHLITAMERGGCQRLIFLSALGATSTGITPFLREKYAAELAVINARVPSRVIIRSPLVWGGQQEDDRFLRSILRVMRYPVYPIPDAKKRLSPIHVSDLVGVLTAACSTLMTDEFALLEMDGGENYSVPDVFKMVAAACTKGTRMGLGGAFGRAFLPLLERDRGRLTRDTPRLKHLLAVSGSPHVDTTTGNNLEHLLPKQLGSFRERLSK